MKFYASLEAFYSQNEARRRSPEADYGVWCRDDRRGGHCRVSYVQTTGEVYSAYTGGEEQVEVLGVVPPDPDDRVQLGYRRGTLTYYRTLDHLLEGWVDHIHEPGGLAWIRKRLAQFSG